LISMGTQTLLHGDCLELMRDIPDKSVDMILCDLPYGTTACKWDTIIPFDRLWEQYERIIKDNGAIVLTATEPFASLLRTSNLKNYKYDWVWVKEKGNGVGTAKYQPLRQTEYVLVFYKKNRYFPQMTKLDKPYKHIITSKGSEQKNWGFKSIKNKEKYYKTYTHKFPNNVLNIPREHNTKNIHPTQKPVALMEYLIKTYTNEGDLVLDNCMGSGTTGVASINLNRNFIGIELDEKYFNIAKQRIDTTATKPFTNRSKK